MQKGLNGRDHHSTDVQFRERGGIFINILESKITKEASMNMHYRDGSMHTQRDSNIDIERESRLLKVCYVPATSAASSKGIFAPATNRNNHTCKAGGTCH